MKRLMIWVTLLLSGAQMMMVSSITSAQPLQYSQQFNSGNTYMPGQSQFDEWLSFRTSLPASGVASITVKGSRDPEGRTCSDPGKAQQIADAMRAGTPGIPSGTLTLSIDCDGFLWNTGSCSSNPSDPNDLEFNVGPSDRVCNCNDNNYVVRPAIFNRNWGGVAGPTCSASSQTMTVTVNAEVNTVKNVAVDIKPGDDPNSINLCSKGAVPVAIMGSDKFDVSDVNTGTLRLAEAAVKTVGKKKSRSLCSHEDVNGDSIDDLVCHFETKDMAGIDRESAIATVNGELNDRTEIEGSDSVNVVKDRCR